MENGLTQGYQLKGGQRTYTIEEILGQGGFGITYRVKAPVKVGSIRMSVNFALKEFFLSNDCERMADASVTYSKPARERVENSRKDFINEAMRLQKIGFSHPNIVGFDEVFEANNTAYYVMEYLRGQSLSEYVKSHGALSEEETISLLEPIMDAVRMLHENRICHLDIKPANIMLAKDDEDNLRPVLIDFGLSKHYDSSGNATSTINTQGYSEGYAPPEQYCGIKTFSPWSDIYALGATLYFCLVGRNPEASIKLRPGELVEMLPPHVSDVLRQKIAVMTLDERARPKSLEKLLPLSTPSDVRTTTKTQLIDAETKPIRKPERKGDKIDRQREDRQENPVSGDVISKSKVKRVEPEVVINPVSPRRNYLKYGIISFLCTAAVTAGVLLFIKPDKSVQKEEESVEMTVEPENVTQEEPASNTVAEPSETSSSSQEKTISTRSSASSEAPSVRPTQPKRQETKPSRQSTASSQPQKIKPKEESPAPKPKPQPKPQEPQKQKPQTQENNGLQPQKVHDF